MAAWPKQDQTLYCEQCEHRLFWGGDAPLMLLSGPALLGPVSPLVRCPPPHPPPRPWPQLRPPEKQLGVVFVLQVLVDEVGEQLLEDVSGVLQAALQAGHDERGHVATVPHGEAAL